MAWHDRLEGETATEWCHRVMCDARADLQLIQEVQAARRAELAWLRSSLEAEGLPEHLIELVVRQWGDIHVIGWNPSHPTSPAVLAHAIISRMGPAIFDETLIEREE